VANDWGSGFTANMTIQNNGSTAINGWTLEFDLAATITNIWNATIVSHVGNHYVIQAAAWNGTIAAGGSVSFGFQAAPGGVSGPANVKLNGVGV
jgi:chitinase